MNEYKVSDYGVFSDAVASTKTFGTSISGVQEAINSAKTTLSDTSIFEGPAQANCISKLESINTDFESINTNYQAISNYLTGTSTNYQESDQNAANAVLGGTSSGTQAATSANSKSGVLEYKVGNIPEAGSQVSTLGKKATLLDVQVDGQSLGQDGSIVIKKGETVHLKVKIPDEIQGVQTLKRTSADGAGGWSQYVSQENTPNVNKKDASTFVDAREYDWYITGTNDTDNITLSQTALFTVPGGNLGSYKGMVRVRVKVVS